MLRAEVKAAGEVVALIDSSARVYMPVYTATLPNIHFTASVLRAAKQNIAAFKLPPSKYSQILTFDFQLKIRVSCGDCRSLRA